MDAPRGRDGARRGGDDPLGHRPRLHPLRGDRLERPRRVGLARRGVAARPPAPRGQDVPGPRRRRAEHPLQRLTRGARARDGHDFVPSAYDASGRHVRRRAAVPTRARGLTNTRRRRAAQRAHRALPVARSRSVGARDGHVRRRAAVYRSVTGRSTAAGGDQGHAGQSQDDAEPLAAGDVLLQHDRGEHDRHDRVERREHGRHADEAVARRGGEEQVAERVAHPDARPRSRAASRRGARSGAGARDRGARRSASRSRGRSATPTTGRPRRRRASAGSRSRSRSPRAPRATRRPRHGARPPDAPAPRARRRRARTRSRRAGTATAGRRSRSRRRPGRSPTRPRSARPRSSSPVCMPR